MIRPIMKSTLILSRPSAPATAQDASVAQDLLDTFAANRRGCAGMAANMIGILKRIIVVDCEGGGAADVQPRHRVLVQSL